MRFSSTVVVAALSAAASAITVSYDNAYDNASGSLTTVACSDGANGLITRYGFQTFGDIPVFPHIGGAAVVPGWNSAECGTCWQLTYAGTGKSINVLVVDHTDTGFNVAQEALDELTNGNAVAFGRIDATATQVAVTQCGLSH
ncbi:eliciting plant response-like protein [Punctularia strigosozonata HHB-11173 SS5]|uniref:eliciting plant response-like protein n=1 Tax=Punctularia strigosozonata (strain HHB-11173) TaxID=741275 RepID=UPI0004416C2D|nr:eliciting plant response-like protein [Punctularia strigosozonata HHB-11173 SS5]EIN07918.1 eliciting plant response-like protein [Punctularia strigosozonata HHB-11173 SS5]